MTDNVIEHEGTVYISIEVLLGVLQMMRAMRDEMVEDDADNGILIPGSDAAINFLTGVLHRARSDFVAQHDLSNEVQEMLGDISDFLEGQ